MGFTRTIGLIFFMTILIGGCVVAVNADSNPNQISYNSIEIPWEQALVLWQNGQVIGYIHTGGSAVYLFLQDGSRRATIAPDQNALMEAIHLCGSGCEFVQSSNL